MKLRIENHGLVPQWPAPLLALFWILLMILSPPRVSAETRYVNLNNPAPAAPYTAWATAATNIQDAVDAASDGDEIVVTNGLYATGGRAVVGANTNRVAVDKPVTVRSVNGPATTIIEGFTPISTSDPGVRCVYLTNGATLIGFTLTNGQSTFYGGGVFCESSGAIVSNCVLVGNSAMDSQGGGALGGTLINCVLSNNLASLGAAAYGSTLQTCLVTDSRTTGQGALDSCQADCCVIANTRAYGNGNGLGAFRSTLNECLLVGNYGIDGGGASDCTLNFCILSNNWAWRGGGAWYSRLTNCVLVGNTAGDGGGAFGGTLNNCTLIGNFADEFGGGTYLGRLNNCSLVGNSSDFAGGGIYASALSNCIVYYDHAPTGANYATEGAYPAVLNYSCTIPPPTNGLGNITNEPAFVDLAGGNLRLQSNSPCINAGRNESAPGATDLDGLPRIVGGTVDIGAYEYQSLDLINSGVVSNRFGFNVTGPSNWVIVLEASSNFTNWIALTTNTLGGSPCSFRDPTPSNSPWRFYRARLQ